MIVRCAKCKDLLVYNSKPGGIIADRCSCGCDAGFQVVQEGNERIIDCWYTNNSPAACELRGENSHLRKHAEEKITTCWYMEDCIWRTGFFHGWSSGYVESDSGPVQLPAAVIEDVTNSRVHVVYAGLVSFNPDHPEKS